MGTTFWRANGKQALRLTTLVPPAPSYRVVAEGGAVGQYRLEVDTRGPEQSYFLHVLQGREANGEDLEAAVTETGAAYTVTLSHPTLGQCAAGFSERDGLVRRRVRLFGIGPASGRLANGNRAFHRESAGYPGHRQRPGLGRRGRR